MRKFIIKILYYIVIIYSISASLEYIVDTGLKKSNDNDFGDWNRIFQGELNNEIIILGNSRAFVQYNPIILENQLGLSCYNLGMDGTPINLQLARLNTLLQYNTSPQALILNIDILSMNKGSGIYSYGQYLPYISNKFINEAISEYKQNIKLTKQIPMLKYNGLFGLIKHGVYNYFKPDNTYGYEKGYLARNIQWQEGSENLKKIVDEDGNIVYCETSLEYGKVKLKNIIDICNNKGIKLILVHTPYYYKLYNHLPQQNKLIEYLNTVAISNNIPFMDYSKDSLMLSTDYFYNMTHLNSKGADIFSTKLAIEFKKILTNK